MVALAAAGCGATATEDRGPGRDAGMGADAAIVCTVVAPTACPDPPLYYADVAPIIRERCVVCHSGKDARWPLTTYQHVSDWYDTIRDMVSTCGMPPPEASSAMTDGERVAILGWIRCGFQP